VLQCVAVCYSVLQCATVCCSVLQCAVVCCSVLQCVAVPEGGGRLIVACVVIGVAVLIVIEVAVCCSVLQCAFSVLQYQEREEELR